MDEEDFSMVFKLCLSIGLPMALKSAIDLNLLQLIRNSAPEPASASQLAAQLPTNDPDRASNMIDRILRFLAGQSIVICHVKTLPGGGGIERFYSLPPAVEKYLTADGDGVSLAPFCILTLHKILTETWYHIKDAVLDGGHPFERAHGSNVFEYFAKDLVFNGIMNKGMNEYSTILMKKIIDDYKGFEGVESLVDVGGGTGSSLKIILSKYPSIKAINFDLPHVIRTAPSHPGVEHIGGDMFASIPEAGAMFMKFICHDWSDEHCQTLLKNCYESLPPKKGKVIIAEFILSEKPDSEAASYLDVHMMSFCPGGKERTEKEFHNMAKLAGFKRFYKVCSAYGVAIMEFHK